MAMGDRERVMDARADQNLVDVARYPPPWEVRDQPSEQ
jgi:serine/threonine-protein kinase ULK/ATG1